MVALDTQSDQTPHRSVQSKSGSRASLSITTQRYARIPRITPTIATPERPKESPRRNGTVRKQIPGTRVAETIKELRQNTAHRGNSDAAAVSPDANPAHTTSIVFPVAETASQMEKNQKFPPLPPPQQNRTRKHHRDEWSFERATVFLSLAYHIDITRWFFLGASQ